MSGYIKKYWKLAIAQIAVLAIPAFLMRRDPSMPWVVGGVLFFVTLSMVTIKSSKIVDLVKRYPAQTRICGYALIGAGILSVFALSILGRNFSEGSWETGAFLMPTMLGCLLITLPQSVARLPESAGATVISRDDQKEGPDSLRQAKAALRLLARNIPAFFRIVGPCATLLVVLPLVALQLAAFAAGNISSVGEPIGKLSDIATAAYLGVYSVTLLLTVPAAALAWNIYLQLGVTPKFLFVPLNRRYWRYCFRIFALGAAVNVFIKMVLQNQPELTTLVGAGIAQIILYIAQYVVWSVGLWLFSNAGFQLPAIAQDDRQVDLSTAIYTTFSLGASYRTGFVLATMPFWISAGLFSKVLIAPLHAPIPIARLFSITGLSFLLFTSVAVGATYLSQAYLHWKNRSIAI